MYPFVAIVIFSVISNVLSGTPPQPPCWMNVTGGSQLQSCFEQVTNHTIGMASGGNYTTVQDFRNTMISFYDNEVKKNCEKKEFTLDKLYGLINFSLSNNTLKLHHKEIQECVKTFEANISLCVRNGVGYFNVSKEEMHSLWPEKMMLQYDSRACENAFDVRNCTMKVISSCTNITRQFVDSLFNVSLSNCNETTISGTAPTAASILTLLIITLTPIFTKQIIM